MFGLYFTWSVVKYFVVTGIFAAIVAAAMKFKAPKQAYYVIAVAFMAVIISSVNTGATVYKADKSAWSPPVLEAQKVEKQVDKKAKAEDNFNATLEKLEAKNP